MEKLKTNKYLYWISLAIIPILALAYKMNSFPLTDHDEALYSGVARELLKHKDWWTLYWNDQPWFIHAPLSMWIQASFFKIFGIAEAVARLHSMFFAVGLVLLTAAFGNLLFGRKTGYIAGLILASSPLFYLIGRMAILDMPLVFFMTLSIYLFVRAWRTQNRRLYPAFWIAAGLATLDKGLWGLVLPGMVCLLYAATDSNRKRLLDPALYVSALGWVAVVGPWFAIETHRWGSQFLEPTLATNTYQRLTTSVCNHSGSWWFYIVIAVIGLFPWIVLWPQSFFKNRGDNSRLLLLWIVPALILHSAARTKLPNYLLPFMPAFALMLAAGVAEAKSRKVQGWSTVFIGAAVTVIVVLGLGTATVPGGALASINPWFIGSFIGAAYVLGGLALVYRKNSGPAIMAVMLLIGLSILPVQYSKVHTDFSPKRTAMEARQLAGNGPVISMLGIDCQFGMFYYAQAPYIHDETFDDLARLISQQKGDYAVVLMKKDLAELSKRGIKLSISYDKDRWVVAR